MSATGNLRARSSRWTERDREREKVLFGQLRTLPQDDSARMAARDELVTMHLPLVEHLARRFRERGELHDDLVQVGTIGLIKAVDRFDTERGVEFSTFATPTIVGEIKRHFRDHGWAIRVPRRLQELRIQISRATAELSQRTGRSPTVREIAQYLEVDEEDVLEGIESAQAYSTLSLDNAGSGGGGRGGDGEQGEGFSIADSLGDYDEALEEVDNRESLKPLLAALSERERQIIMLRFFKHMTQTEIAKEIGISQMHVSRTLAKALSQLRDGLADHDD